MSASHILIAVALFQLKHYIADFLLQSRRMVVDKGKYGHPAGLLHVAVHVALTLPILLYLGVAGKAIALAMLIEALVHYHIDWGKERLTALRLLTPSDSAYWYSLGADQLLHQLTYICIVAVWAV
ncbi:DUF3307 domain-containing protein [Sedimentimonas flavescens]|uniref:DUF3307 domain-containing protein n=1 Tax=Sedimentimonas flavescens TaxID=2851012 RepID=UPI0021A6BF10|nr:DUF3307 domain-containing protein [Sedimentimonas flavescens]MCT2541104.1 DUF3307 domain-containing protein [Sedimentimonas flavescens]